MVVQNEMLMSEMNDRIHEMVIYEEPTDPDSSIDLYEYRCRTPSLAETEDFDAIVSLDPSTFEVKRSKMEELTTRIVKLYLLI